MQNARECLRDRVYYAVKDGMSITLYTLLAESPVEEVEDILNEVMAILSLCFYNKNRADYI